MCVVVLMAVDKRRRDTCLEVLQMLRNMLQGVTGVLQYMAGVMLCVAVCCSVSQCVTVYYRVLRGVVECDRV